MEPLLQLKEVRAGYNNREVLKGLSLDITSQIVTILGWNGSGKSTLLKSINGNIRIYSGQIFFNSEQINQMSIRERKYSGISLCLQGNRCFKNLTVNENFRVGCQFIKHQNHNDLINKVLMMFPELSKRMNSKAGSLSSGMQQQLNIAIAMVSNPKLLLLDEPSLGLDIKAQNRLHDLIIKYIDNNRSVIITEQNKEFAKAISSSTYWIENGKVINHLL